MQSIGDLASFFFSSRFQGDLKSAVERAARAMTTGEVEDKTRHLGGTSLALSLLDRKSSLLQQHKLGIAEASIFARASQSALDRIQNGVEEISKSLALHSQTENPAGFRTVVQNARDTFNDVVRAVNTEFAGRYVFSGSATSRSPLPNGETMLAALTPHLAGVTTANDLIDGIETWFDLPTGGFESSAYGGSSTGFVSMPLNSATSATFGLRADDPVIRDTLKSLAIAVFAGDSALGLSISEQQEALSHARSGLGLSTRNLIEERSSLGLTEALIDKAGQQVEEGIASLNRERLELVGVDPFEEASRFEAAQQQLEILYRIAARQGSSLAEYLR